MTRLSAILIILFAVSCNRSNYYENHAVTQTVDAKSVKFVEIACHCPNGVDVTTAEDKNSQIKINRESGSLRRPGGHMIPEEVAGEGLSFTVEQWEDTLRIISKEPAYKNRSSVIEKLSITIPDGMQYRIKNIPAIRREEEK